MDVVRKILTACDFKASPGDENFWEGYGSTFGNPDSVGDVMEPGCFASSLDSFRDAGFLGLGHDWSGLPIGYITEAREDAHGLFLRGGWHDTAPARDARRVATERLQAGKSVGLSIGFRAERAEPVDTANPHAGRRFQSVKLYEVSLVTVPCNGMAGMTDAKSLDGDAFERDLDRLDRKRLEDLSKTILARLKALEESAPADAVAEAHRIATSSAIARAVEAEMYLGRILNQETLWRRP